MFPTSDSSDSYPRVSIGVGASCISPSTRPTVCVTICVPALSRSCSSQAISTMRQPSLSKNRRNASARRCLEADLPTRTLSKTSGRPDQEPLPESGPNMGWVQTMSKSRGSAASMARFGYSLTLRTSTKSVERLRRWAGRERRTAPVFPKWF